MCSSGPTADLAFPAFRYICVLTTVSCFYSCIVSFISTPPFPSKDQQHFVILHVPSLMSLGSQFMYVLDESVCQLLELVNDARLTGKSSEATASIRTVEGGLHGRCKGKGRTTGANLDFETRLWSMADSLFTLGSPSCLTCPASVTNPRELATSDCCPDGLVIPRPAWTGFHGAISVIGADSSS
jgi:hypothetical protein